MRNPLDEAILAGAGIAYRPPRKLDEIAYDFARRRVPVVVQEGGGARCLTNGSFPQLLEVCERVRDGGEPVRLMALRRAALEERVARWSGDGLRVLGVATLKVARK
jgi:P-type Mg2+ transporter